MQSPARLFGSFRRGRSVLVVSSLAVVATGILAIARPSISKTPPTPPPAAMTVTTTSLNTTSLTRSVTLNGSIHPWQEIIVGPEVSGFRVTAVKVDVGDVVKKGQELVRLADEVPTAELTARRALLQQAEASLLNANAAYRRAESLSASGVLSTADFDRLRSEQVAAQAAVATAKADAQMAELKLKHTRVIAPDAGVVAARTVTVGQVAQAGSDMLRLLRQGRLEWRAEVPEARMHEFKPGLKVQMTTADGASFAGTVRSVSPTVQSDTRTGIVYVDIDAAARARAGMFARGEIAIGQAMASSAPIESIVMHDGYSYVFVVNRDQVVQRRRVETGAIIGKRIEILGGLTAQERIVERGAGFLKDGDRVNVVVAIADKNL
jgi:RND family efflux transporter MFP subunit